MEVKIKDFNCITEMDLEFKPGFTIIQGPSNSGKSSIIKAIENCIFNQSGTTNVRQGCKNYSIGIRKGDRTVSLIKGKDTKYKIDDVVYEKIGVNQLTEVAEALNIRETVLGGEKVRLNFSKQMSYPFLLDKTPGQLYRFIVDSSESESLSNVLKDINKDIKDLDKAIIQNEAQIDILTKQQIQLEDNLKDSTFILDVSNQIINLDTENNHIENLVKCKDSYLSITSEINGLSRTIESLNIDFNINELDALKTVYEGYLSTYNKYKITKDEHDSLLQKIKQLDIQVDMSQLDESIINYTKLTDLSKEYKTVLNKVSEIKDIIKTYTLDIDEESKKLAEFKICPLCGNEIKDDSCQN